MKLNKFSHSNFKKLKKIKLRILFLIQEVVRLHPYEVPEFVSLPIDHVSEPYGQWVLKNSLPDPAETEENS